MCENRILIQRSRGINYSNVRLVSKVYVLRFAGISIIETNVIKVLKVNVCCNKVREEFSE